MIQAEDIRDAILCRLQLHNQAPYPSRRHRLGDAPCSSASNLSLPTGSKASTFFNFIEKSTECLPVDAFQWMPFAVPEQKYVSLMKCARPI